MLTSKTFSGYKNSCNIYEYQFYDQGGLYLFYGTKWFYRVLYFITAMSPAYFLFLLQLDDKFKKPFDCELRINKTIVHLDIYWWCGILLAIVAVLSLLLKELLIRQYMQSTTDQILPPENEFFKEEKLEERNGSIISFLLGNVLPAVLIIESELFVAIAVFIIIQFVIYVLVIKSTDIFPNINLILLGVNLCKTSNNKYVFTFKSRKYEKLKVYRIGNPQKTKIHITMYKK